MEEISEDAEIAISYVIDSRKEEKMLGCWEDVINVVLWTSISSFSLSYIIYITLS